MKIIYFDAFSGCSGDMILGALLDAGLPEQQLRADLALLGLTGYELQVSKSNRKHLHGTKVTVTVVEEPGHHHHRHYEDIESIIDGSKLAEQIKVNSLAVVKNLALAEGHVHGIDYREVHFHEVGAIDSIVDIVGSVIGLHRLGIEKIYSSPLHVGTGFVNCAHGTFPVPAPATSFLLSGVPVYGKGIPTELVTPTGAAILKTLCTQFGSLPPSTIEKVGYGVGSKDIPDIPNLLRVFIGRLTMSLETDQVTLIESNLDDMNPEFCEHVALTLQAQGALDVSFIPIYMKKQRPGILIQVLAPPDKARRLAYILMKESSTLGVRYQTIDRLLLPRTSLQLDTRHGKISAKKALLPDGHAKITPEYESCRRLAQELDLPLREIYQAALVAADSLATCPEITNQHS